MIPNDQVLQALFPSRQTETAMIAKHGRLDPQQPGGNLGKLSEPDVDPGQAGGQADGRKNEAESRNRQAAPTGSDVAEMDGHLG